MKRDIYSKLMKLQSAEADALLESKFSELDASIRAAKDNNTIYKQLEALEQFIYKVSDKAVALATYLIDMEPIPPKTYKTQFGPYEGKDHEDIVKKVLELLNRIRYYQTREIISTYFDLYKVGARKDLENHIRDIAQYNLDALNQIGYSAQLHIVDFLNTYKPQDKVYLDFFVEVAQHLASAEGEAHNMKDENTLVFGYAPLPYNKDIERIRNWLLDEFEKLLAKPKIDLERKLKLVDLLNSLTHGPHRGKSSNELDELIEGNAKRVMAIYKKLIGTKANTKLVLPLALEIEEKLIFIERGAKSKALLEDIEGLFKQLSENYFYSIYRVLVGAKLDFLSRKNETYEEAHAANEKERSELIRGLVDKDSAIVGVLEEVATYWGKVDAWKLNSYGGFLAALAKEKPKLAYEILERASENDTQLMKFAGDFILGFRNGNATEEYEKAIELVVAGKHREAVRLICLAMTIGELTDEDIAIATEILRHKARFNFLKREDGPSYTHFLMEVFTKLLPQKKEEYDALFIELLNNYDKDLHSFDIITVQRNTDFNNVSDVVRECVVEKLLTTSDISYHHQELLLGLYGTAEELVAFFIERIKIKEQNPNHKRREYDTVPYHLNDELKKAIRDDKDYSDIFKNSMASFTPKWSIYNSELSELFKRVGGYKKAVVEVLNDKTNKNRLKQVMGFFDGIATEPIDLDIAIEIVKQTGDKKVWSSVRSHIWTTGLVSGEYGLANEHQRKHDYLKEHYAKSTNKRVNAFVKETLIWLEAQVKAERQRTNEELRLRKVDFEH